MSTRLSSSLLTTTFTTRSSLFPSASFSFQRGFSFSSSSPSARLQFGSSQHVFSLLLSIMVPRPASMPTPFAVGPVPFFTNSTPSRNIDIPSPHSRRTRAPFGDDINRGNVNGKGKQRFSSATNNKSSNKLAMKEVRGEKGPYRFEAGVYWIVGCRDVGWVEGWDDDGLESFRRVEIARRSVPFLALHPIQRFSVSLSSPLSSI
ncbi:hypothetical protein BDY24DRAFT_93537 [Mrakia frigida]|uniref:uncharacterized protein n=1 Tax=Mrakia frigida TaxID=29902 RepID=UPI003FCC2243